MELGKKLEFDLLDVALDLEACVSFYIYFLLIFSPPYYKLRGLKATHENSPLLPLPEPQSLYAKLMRQTQLRGLSNGEIFF
jgi:hypothetical protein